VTAAADAELLEPMRPALFVVEGRTVETADTVTLRVAAVGDEHPGFAPGQFSMVYAVGVGEVPISISGDPAWETSLEYTIRSVGGVTNALWALGPGDSLGVRGPYGNGWPLGEAEGRDLLVIAGGIGLAPLRPVVLHALAHRDRYRRLSLLYGARTPDDLLFSGLLDDWRSEEADVEVTVDRGTPGWAGDVGVVTQLVTRVSFEPHRTTALVCGPEVMMRAVARRLRADGVDPADVHVSLERNMQCGIGLCGHCQLGAAFVCRDGPIFPYDRAGRWLEVAEL
jgi:anaerobic sulfite reductase subunit B